MKNTCLFYIVFQVMKVLLIKITGFLKKDTGTSSFISYCFTLTFTSADIIFHNFLELYSTLSEKLFVKNVPFLTDSL